MNFTGEPESKCTLSNPHSSAFVDLNGDCLAGNLYSWAQQPVAA